jgi:hypothetical protein
MAGNLMTYANLKLTNLCRTHGLNIKSYLQKEAFMTGIKDKVTTT